MPTFTASQVSTMQGYLSAAQGYLQAGNTSAALNSIATYYSYQSSLLGGQGYASIAAQVVTNTGTYGKVANQLLINALGQSQYDSIKANLAYSLANDDLNDIKGNGNNVATISQVEANHMTEFEIFKIPIDA